MSKVKTPIDEMTREEYQQLRDELEHLKTVERNDISEKIRVARGFGDLSENSEYDEAKNDQARLEARISRLEDRGPHLNRYGGGRNQGDPSGYGV